MRVYLIASGKKEVAPIAPSSLTATAVSSSRIDLAWVDNSSDEDGFKIESSLDGVNFTEITTVGAGVTTYASTGLSANTQYYYRVRAYKGALNSAYSNTANATTSAVVAERIITINTANIEAGSSANNQFNLVSATTGANYTVDWGDGVVETVTTTGGKLHTYPASGIYDIKITGVFQHAVNDLASADRRKYIDIKNWGTVTHNGTVYQGAFHGCRNLNVTATDAPIINSATNCTQFFRDCRTMTTPDFSSWTFRPSQTQAMFRECFVFNGNISTWDMSLCTNTSLMFSTAYAFNQPIGNWNVGSVTNMSGMFAGAFTPKHAFNQDISSWNVSNVTNMSTMFQNSNFNQNISSWNVGNVTNMQGMFGGNTVFNQNISSWDVSKVTDMSAIFSGCTSFNQPIGSWNVANVTTFSQVLDTCVNFNQDLSSWNVGKSVSFFNAFNSCNAMVNNSSILSWNIGQNITGTNTVSLSSLFANVDYNQDLSLWDMIRVSNISTMLVRGKSNFNYGVWDIRNVTNAGSFMASATSLSLSATNLANMYIAWASLPVRSISISFGSAKYDASGASARAILTAPRAVSVSGAIDPNANGSYPWNGTRYENALGWRLIISSGQWNLVSPSSNTRATSTGIFPTQNVTQPATATGWTGAESGIVVTMTGAGWTITDGGQL